MDFDTTKSRKKRKLYITESGLKRRSKVKLLFYRSSSTNDKYAELHNYIVVAMEKLPMYIFCKLSIVSYSEFNSAFGDTSILNFPKNIHRMQIFTAAMMLFQVPSCLNEVSQICHKLCTTFL